MDFSTIGSIGAYAKNLRLQTRWNQKKASGDVTAHMDAQGNLKPRKTQIASEYQAMIDGQNGEGGSSKKLSEIMDKVSNGKKLTPEEEKILQAEDPVVYARYRSVEEERKSYEQELKRCKTRDEVQRVKMTHMNNTMMAVKSVANNPKIPEEKKMVLLGIEKSRMEKISTSTNTFVRSGEYAKLPTDREKQEAEKELRELKEAERKPKSERAEKNSPAEEREKTEAAKGDETEAETEKTSGTKENSAAEEQKQKSAGQEKTELKRRAEPKSESELEARSPEVRKTRRAKAKAAYAAARSGGDPEPTLDLNA